MANSSLTNFTLAIILSGLAAIIFLVIYIFTKLQEISSLKVRLNHQDQIIKDLEHQARLIIKSDIELKLYQEEVEDKLNKLTLLKNLILSSIHIVDKEDLLEQISENLINQLGFKRALILDYTDLGVKLNIGLSNPEIETIRNFLLTKKKIFLTNPLVAGDNEVCLHLTEGLGTAGLLIAPIKARESIHAIFIIANPLLNQEIKITEKAIFTIICIYLGQCLDNIRLFEEQYLAKDDLEKKIKEKTNDLLKSLREIEVISKKKTDFISSVSHELRTPLTSVKGFSALLIDEKFGVLPPEAKKRLVQIDENVNKLVDMVNTLLDIARIESGKTEIKIAPADLTKLIRETADFFLPQVGAKKIRLLTEAPEELMAFMDKNLIERVLINLINNAIKFTPENGAITVMCLKHPGYVLVSVSDTGCGMSKEEQAKLFQEFFRADNPINRQVRGTGLGLSLVKRIIETHKQKIWVESELNKGTSINFTLKI